MNYLFNKLTKEIMQKARVTKYIRRIPNPKGKGFLYFYTQAEWAHYKKTGEIPKQHGEKKGFFAGIMDFFGFKDEKKAEEKVEKDYAANSVKEKFKVSLSDWSKHLAEYFNNKLKWDALFLKKLDAQNNVKKALPGYKDEALKQEYEASKKIAEEVKKNVFNLTLMYFIYNFYNKEGQKNETTTAHTNTGNDTGNRPGKIPTDSEKVLSEPIETDTLSNVPERKFTDNSGVNDVASSVSGERSGRDVRLTKGQIKATRQQIKDLLASKTDEEMTEADKALLRQYEGAGGLKEEGASDNAVLYEYYTPRSVVSKMWQLVNKYTGTDKILDVLEPSAGIGRFAENQKHDFTMIEYEEDSYRINKILNPDADVRKGAFQQLFMHGGKSIPEYKGQQFDVVIGNPPYGAYSGMEAGLGEGKIHTTYPEYFMDRGLQTLKDGGIMAFIVPSAFLRGNKYSEAKSAIAKQGKILESYRLPNGTFGTTGIGTDIIIMRKEPGNVNDFLDDKYFKDNPEHVLGDTTIKRGKFGPEQYTALRAGETFDGVLSSIDTNAVPVIAKGQPSAKAQVEEKVKVKNAVTSPKTKTIKKSADNFETMPDKETDSAESFNKKYNQKYDKDELEIWKAADYTGAINLEKLNDKEKKLVEKSDDFCLENGKYTHVTNYASGDIYQKLEDLEKAKGSMPEAKYEKQKKILEDAAPVYKTVKNFTVSPISEFAKNFTFINEDGQEKGFIQQFFKWAMGDSRSSDNMDWSGGVTQHDIPAGLSWSDISDYIHQISVRSQKGADPMIAAKIKEMRREVAEKLVKRFMEMGLNPDEQKQLEEKYNKQFNSYKAPNFLNIPLFVDGISKTFKGDPLTVKNKQMNGISFLANKGDGILVHDVGGGKTMSGIIATVNQIQSGRAKRPFICVPKAVYKNWLTEIRDLFPTLKINQLGNMRKESVPADLKIEEGSLSVMTYEGLEQMTFKPETINGDLINDMLDAQAYQNAKSTDRTDAKQREKLLEDLGMSVSAANEVITGSGAQEIKLKSKDGLKRHMASGDKPIEADRIKSAFKLYGANFLVVKDSDGWTVLESKSGLAAGSAGTREAAIEKVVNNLTGKGEEWTKKMLSEQTVINPGADNNFETMPEGKAVKSTAFYFEDLGFDHITIDEMHNFKNVFGEVKATSSFSKGKDGKEEETVNANEFSGLKGGIPSRQAKKMFAITQIIQKNNEDRNVFGLTATPFTNSPLEIYNMLSLVARKKLKALGMYNMHEFMAHFAKLRTELSVSLQGEIKSKAVMKEFQNLSALQNLVKEYMDKVTSKEFGVKVPDVTRHQVELNMTPTQKAIYKVEMERFNQKDANGRPVPGAALRAINNMRMATVSPSLVNFTDPKTGKIDEMYKGSGIPEMVAGEDFIQDSPKLKFIFDSVAKFYDEKPNIGQVVYMPRGISKIDLVIANLVKQGVPKDAIAVMVGSGKYSKTDEEKEAVKREFNDPDGKIKVIIGSETIQEGVNLNGNTAVLYNTMLGWNPAEPVQVEGRIVRQGNRQDWTHIVYPQLIDSVDAGMYQKHDEKMARFNALWDFDGDSIDVSDINPEELKFDLIKDPERRASFIIDQKKQKLEDQKREGQTHIDMLKKFKNDYIEKTGEIEAKTKRLPEYENDVKEAETEVTGHENELKDYKARTSKKDPDFESSVTIFERRIKNAKEKVQDEKKYLRDAQKEIAFAEKDVKWISEKLNNMGLSVGQVDARILSKEKEVEGLYKEQTDLDENKEKIIEQAIKDIAEAKRTAPSVSTVINDHVKLLLKSLRSTPAELSKNLEKAIKLVFKRYWNPETEKYKYKRIR